ncbi:MAG: pyridoxine 5'-phosphate synthase [Gammaproteobacteria bacterium]|nr:MAG: pyridoxine 5'-phosphate synthase [Gammaproteobacteria bacterium]
MIALSVNLNKIALIRNSREGNFPDVQAFAQLAIAAGAEGITVHPRPDQRHIRVSDVEQFAGQLPVEFNIEGNPFAGPMPSPRAGISAYPGFMSLVEHARPQQCTLVPDNNSQLTSDHGFDLAADGARLKPVIQQLRDWGCRISLFMDPDSEQIRRAADLGADRIELYTGPFAAACHQGHSPEAIGTRYREAAQTAVDLGLGVNAGHDLNLVNIPHMRDWPGLLEVSIGHALTVDALLNGFSHTIQAYRQALNP